MIFWQVLFNKITHRVIPRNTGQYHEVPVGIKLSCF